MKPHLRPMGGFWRASALALPVFLSVTWPLHSSEKKALTNSIGMRLQAISSGTYPDFAPTDIDGEPRYAPSIDVGADEFHAPAGGL